jgi:hypothetical protein
VPNIACVSGLFIPDCPFGFLNDICWLILLLFSNVQTINELIRFRTKPSATRTKPPSITRTKPSATRTKPSSITPTKPSATRTKTPSITRSKPPMNIRMDIWNHSRLESHQQ